MNAPPPPVLEDQAELLRVLGHPMRLAILAQLRGGERSVGDLAECTGFGLSALSQQLAILRKAALVSARREAKQVFYTLVPETLRRAGGIVDELAQGAPAPDRARPAADRPADGRLGAAMFARVTRPGRG